MSETSFLIPSVQHRAEQVIDRSRFIATIAHTPTPPDARAFIDAIRSEFPDATHNCWAYVCGPPASTANIGMSDAGEPHGTAGRPMLDVLLHSGVGEITAVVTRYYGGTKLGTGGLVKAYGGSVQLALASLPTARRVLRVEVRIDATYADIDIIRRSLAEFDGTLVSELYDEHVRYVAAIPSEAIDRFATALVDRTAGRAAITPYSA